MASWLVARSNSVRKIRPFAMTGEDNPDPTAAFQSTFLSEPNSTGGLPSPIPVEFGPRNCGQESLSPSSAAAAHESNTTSAKIMISEVFVIVIPLQAT